MSYVDDQVINIAEGMDQNIASIATNGVSRDLASKNVLSDCRSFVEHVILQVYSHQTGDYHPGPEDEYKKIYLVAIPWIKAIAKYKFLIEFHSLLQRTNSHFVTQVEEGSRLLLHYFSYLVRIVHLEEKEFGICLLSRLSKYPLDQDNRQVEYYRNVLKVLLETKDEDFVEDERAYYIVSKRLHRLESQIFFELVLTPASDHVDKFNRFTVFTLEDVMDQYAIRASFANKEVDLLGIKVGVTLIEKWQISIRPAELKNYARLVGVRLVVNRADSSYSKLMSFLRAGQIGINELFDLNDGDFTRALLSICSQNSALYIALSRAYNCINNKEMGYKTIKYLSVEMRNAVIKRQMPKGDFDHLRDTSAVLSKACYPFECAPFSASLQYHNPVMSNLLKCLDPTSRTDELLARQIRNNSLLNNDIFLSESDAGLTVAQASQLVTKYNSKVMDEMKILSFGNNFYIKGVLESTEKIISILEHNDKGGIKGYESSANLYLNSLHESEKDDQEKVDILSGVFVNHNIGLVYGPAGTGKTTLLARMCALLDGVDIVAAAHTQSALDHLKRAIKGRNVRFFTLSQLKKKQVLCKLFVIDECSVVDNMTMLSALKNVTYEAAFFVGDIGQLEPIRFGNWFFFAKHFFKETVYELTNKYRTDDEGLIALWDSVRMNRNDIGPIIQRHHYSCPIDSSVFQRETGEDEICLCLAYGGLYGINNVNSYLQTFNANPPVEWAHKIYKAGDPILFIDNARFGDLLYNNLKGRIIEVTKTESYVRFRLEVESPINQLQIIPDYKLSLISVSPSSSIVEFDVTSWNERDDDNNNSIYSIVPFQIAYACSIHKAQGLEYDSVKIIITSDFEEEVDINVFYTAITRSKKKLKIYWSPETERKIVSSFSINDHKKDLLIYRNYCKAKKPLIN